MAVEWLLDEEDKNNLSGAFGQNLGSGSGQTQTKGPVISGSSTQPNTPTKSGSFTNLQQYIDENKGRDFSTNVANKIDTDIQQGQSQLSSAKDYFTNAVDSSTLGFDDNLKNKLESSPESLSQEEKSKLTKLRDSSYQGPTAFGSTNQADDPFNQLNQYYSGLSDLQTATESTAGQKSLLDKYYKRPDYTAGQKNLDTLILSGNKAPIEQKRQDLVQAQDAYKDTSTQLSDYAKAAQQQSMQNQDAFNRLLGLVPSEEPSLFTKNIDALKQKASDRLNEQQLAYDSLKQGNINQYVDPALAQSIMSTPSLDRMYNTNPLDYVGKVDPNLVNYQTVASPEDLARIAALSEIAGTDQSYLDPNAVGQYDNESLVTYDPNRLMQDQLKNKALYENELRSKIGDSLDPRYPTLDNWADYWDYTYTDNDAYKPIVRGIRDKYGYYNLKPNEFLKRNTFL